jgi:hypothetical protein
MLPQGLGFVGPSVLLDKFVYLLFVIAEFFAPVKDFMDKIVEKVVADTLPDSSHKPVVLSPINGRIIFPALFEHTNQNFDFVPNDVKHTTAMRSFYLIRML